ncbi:hypothetical protein ABZ498_18630 [Streptomyces lavendulocolor]|uniref:hypothetical protein n=1 Tax=Streptomyces lavendulocolor TaxID=67316 RepID=UPI0033E5717E
MVDTVAADPDAATASFADFGSADALWDLIITTSPEADRAVYTDPVFRQAFRHAVDEAFSQGPAGYARDTVLAMARWPFDLAGITVPIDLWYGQHDTSPVLSRPRRIAGGDAPDGNPASAPRRSGILIWTHTEAVLRTLLDHAR